MGIKSLEKEKQTWGDLSLHIRKVRLQFLVCSKNYLFTRVKRKKKRGALNSEPAWISLKNHQSQMISSDLWLWVMRVWLSRRCGRKIVVGTTNVFVPRSGVRAERCFDPLTIFRVSGYARVCHLFLEIGVSCTYAWAVSKKAKTGKIMKRYQSCSYGSSPVKNGIWPPVTEVIYVM